VLFRYFGKLVILVTLSNFPYLKKINGGLWAITEFVPKFHVALHAYHVALPMVTLEISPGTNVTLTFNFDFGLDHPLHGGYGWGSPTPRRRSNCQTNKLKSGYGPKWGTGTKTNWPTDRRSQCNLKLNLRHCTANYRPVLSSDRAPYMGNKESNCHSKRGKTPRRTGLLTVGRNVTSTSTCSLKAARMHWQAAAVALPRMSISLPRFWGLMHLIYVMGLYENLCPSPVVWQSQPNLCLQDTMASATASQT
jgi:hypothetical protein